MQNMKMKRQIVSDKKQSTVSDKKKLVRTNCFNSKLEMCQYDTDAPAQRPSSPGNKHFAKKRS